MLQSEKTPKRSSATIRKDLAEKAAAELRAKGGEVGKSFEKNLKRAREEAPAALNKIKRSASASTPGASAGAKTMRVAGRFEKIGGSVGLDLVNPLSPAVGFTTPASVSRLDGSEDQSPRWPDVQKHAKAMLDAVRKRDKDSIPGIETFNLERILSLLAEAMLRVDGLKRPYSRKREEASKIQQLELDLKAAVQRATDAEAAKKGAEEAQKKADESAKKADEALKKAQADLGKLKTKVERLEKDAALAQQNFAVTLEAEQNRLVAESDADNDARMKIDWAALYPEADYSIWAVAHSYAEYVVYLREQGEPEPASFEAWLSSNEPAAPELPGPGEAHQIPSDDEEKGETQEAPSAGQGAPSASQK